MNIAKNLTKISSIISIICSIGVIVAAFLPYLTNNEGTEYTIQEFSRLFENVDSYMIVEKMLYLTIAVMALNIILQIFTGSKWVTVISAEIVILAHITIHSMANIHHLFDATYTYGFTVAAICIGLMLISLFFSLTKQMEVSEDKALNKTADIENDKEVELLREQYETLEKSVQSVATEEEQNKDLIAEEEITVTDDDLIDSADVWVEDANGNEEEYEKTRLN